MLTIASMLERIEPAKHFDREAGLERQKLGDMRLASSRLPRCPSAASNGLYPLTNSCLALTTPERV